MPRRPLTTSTGILTPRMLVCTLLLAVGAAAQDGVEPATPTGDELRQREQRYYEALTRNPRPGAVFDRWYQQALEGEDAEPFKVSVGVPEGWGSDHFPFVAHGVPTIGLGTESAMPEDRFYGHTRADTAEKVYERGLTECAAIDAQLLYHVANLPERPARRKTQAEMEELFRSHDFMDTLELLDLWPSEHVKERYFNISEEL